MSQLVVKELTASLRDDFLLFFDSVAFADNPDWSDCYCSAYHFANKGKAESRRQASSLIEEDRIHGFLAYDNGKPVGWCNAASRTSYPALHWLMGPGPDKAERVGSIVCFVVASSHRNQGVASHLLNAACKKFSQKGLEFAEAYPVKKPQSAAYNFPGPLSMYLKNGFITHRDADWYLVVRKRLAAI
ncbi:MAG TPA: GNAT family N-acetyltransferase [Candidatus Bathyarchaeia archaeon]|nr:GNAT family N-acetyltransferase [Candidatus Bathyarchaeia archaeon]